MESVILTVIWAAVIQGLLLGITFIFSRKYRSFANRLLGFFLITFVFEALTALLPYDRLGSYSLSGSFTLPVTQIFIPTLFMHFVLEKIGRSSRHRVFLRIHYYAAFGIAGITVVNVFLFFFTGNQIVSYLGYGIVDRFYLMQQSYAFLLTAGVFAFLVKEIIRYQQLVRNAYSDYDLLEINWLWQFVLVQAPAIALWGAELLRIALGGTGQSELVTVIWVFIAIFNYFVSYKAFIHPNLFDTSEAENAALADFQEDKEKPRTEIDQKLCEKLVSEMESGKFYLAQDLTLHDFAKEIDISPRLVSSCINQTLGLNFNEWVNNYRVERVIALLQEKESEQFSIAGLGMEAGFKSRSAMYVAFKKKTGRSPGHFRKE